MQGAEERRLRRISHTPQGGASEGNAADDILTVDQGFTLILPKHSSGGKKQMFSAWKMMREQHDSQLHHCR
jgi:hypothetical protein